MLRNDALPSGYLYEEPVALLDRPSPLLGPAWSLLQDFYDTSGSGAISPVQADGTRNTGDATGQRNNLSPLVTQIKLYFSFAFGPANIPIGRGGLLRMYLYPVVVLNNPYNRPLAAEDYSFAYVQHNTQDATEMLVRVIDGSTGDTIRTFEGDGFRFKDGNNALFDPRPKSGSNDYSGTIKFFADGLAFEPGETKVLTLDEAGAYEGRLNSSYVSSPAHPTENPKGNRLTPGFNDSMSAYVEFKDGLEVGEEPDFYEFDLVNPGNLRFKLRRQSDEDGLGLALLTMGYSDFSVSTIPLPPRLTRSETTFPEAGFTYTLDLGQVPHLADFNPRAPVITLANNFERFDGGRPPRLYRGDFGIDEFSTNVSDADSGAGFFGPSHETAGFGQTILFEIPKSPEDFISLGQLKHVDLSIWPQGNATRFYEEANHNAPAYVLGNSRADPRVGTTTTYTDTDSEEWYRLGAAFDNSYRANEALWDGFFFSTAPINGDPPLNRRIVSKTPEFEPPEGAYDAGKNLSLAGAFNVNSVSVNAWRAILSGLQDHDLETINAGTEQGVDFLYGSIGRPLEASFSHNSQDASSAEVWNGARRLKPAEIDALAEAIVAEIKERGPFLNLAHFVNRALVEPAAPAADSTVVEKGALQSAIDKAELGRGGTGLNEGLGGNSVDQAYLDMDVPHPELFATLAFEGAPGRLTQADLLTALGPILSARSDTFRIRAYGETEDSGNKSKAWCEAIVRRIPDKVDLNEAVEDPSPADSFGRRFEIVSFQWLPPQEENPPL